MIGKKIKYYGVDGYGNRNRGFQEGIVVDKVLVSKRFIQDKLDQSPETYYLVISEGEFEVVHPMDLVAILADQPV